MCIIFRFKYIQLTNENIIIIVGPFFLSNQLKQSLKKEIRETNHLHFKTEKLKKKIKQVRKRQQWKKT